MTNTITSTITSTMTDDEEFQASSEDIDIKPWDLPYWKGAPKQEVKQEVEVEDDVEQEVDFVEPLTVEELEKISNEAYDEGFLQGLNEGREKGELEGKAQGLAAGKKEGKAQGQQEGNRIGFEAGQAEGLALGKDEITKAAASLAQLSRQLEQSLAEKDSALPQVISQLIKTACETIIERELEQGDNQITQKIFRALDQLPNGAENIHIFISSADALHLEHGLSSSGREMHFDIDDTLATGSARITTKQSLIEFSHSDRMQQVFEYIDQQCEKLDLSDIDGEAELDIPVEVDELAVDELAVDESDIDELDVNEGISAGENESATELQSHEEQSHEEQPDAEQAADKEDSE